MSAQQNSPRNVIRRDTVRVVPQAAMLDCGDSSDSSKGQPIAVVPVLDGDRIAGFEIRCGCGASAIVECVYQNPPRDVPPTPEV